MAEQIVITTLTLGVVVVNLLVAFRAFRTAVVMDTSCRWLCVQGSRSCGLIILIGFGVICLILAMLKLWSVMDVFVDRWGMMPREYHVRSFAYLAENYGVAILGWKATTYIKIIGNCDGNGRKKNRQGGRQC